MKFMKKKKKNEKINSKKEKKNLKKLNFSKNFSIKINLGFERFLKRIKNEEFKEAVDIYGNYINPIFLQFKMNEKNSNLNFEKKNNILEAEKKYYDVICNNINNVIDLHFFINDYKKIKNNLENNFFANLNKQEKINLKNICEKIFDCIFSENFFDFEKFSIFPKNFYEVFQLEKNNLKKLDFTLIKNNLFIFFIENLLEFWCIPFEEDFQEFIDSQLIQFFFYVQSEEYKDEFENILKIENIKTKLAEIFLKSPNLLSKVY